MTQIKLTLKFPVMTKPDEKSVRSVLGNLFGEGNIVGFELTPPPPTPLWAYLKEGWFVGADSPDGGPRIERNVEEDEFETDFAAWRHVINRGVQDRSPPHWMALDVIRQHNATEWERITYYAAGMGFIDLSMAMGEPPSH